MRIVKAALFFLLLSSQVFGDAITDQAHDDAKVIRRLAEISKRDLPQEPLLKIVDENLDLLRGKRGAWDFQYARFVREEAGRVTDGFDLPATKTEKIEREKIRGSGVYRLIVSAPARRLVVAKNRRSFIERADVEYTRMDGTKNFDTVKIDRWIAPGEERGVDLPEIARDATVTVYARRQVGESGKAAVALALLKAKLEDDPDSPYQPITQDMKLLGRAIEQRDLFTIRNLTQSIIEATERQPASLRDRVTRAGGEVERAGASLERPRQGASEIELIELQAELQLIEDLLTGSENERREGLDRLHQLIRRIRPAR